MTSLASRIWAGDRNAIDEARARYYADPHTQLIPFARALYSFRTRAGAAAEFRGLRKKLRERADSILGGDSEEQDIADAADMLSTWFAWFGEHAFAIRIAEFGLRYTKRTSDQGGNHSWCLLKLTIADVHWRQGDVRRMKKCLDDVLFHQKVEDPNQRARVYRKLGMLCRKVGRRTTGFQCALRACVVRGIPLNVRLKSAGALFGIER